VSGGGGKELKSKSEEGSGGCSTGASGISSAISSIASPKPKNSPAAIFSLSFWARSSFRRFIASIGSSGAVTIPLLPLNRWFMPISYIPIGLMSSYFNV
jgi:hypothetical protein